MAGAALPAPLRDARLAAQLLGRRTRRTPGEVVGHLLAVQAQDHAAARLALRARSASVSAREIDAALVRGELCAAWLLRGTLHLVRREDHGWLLALLAPTRRAASRRRLGQEGVPPGDADRAVVLVERALADHGPRTRAELGATLERAGIRTAGQALPHLLLRAALDGVCVLGPLRDGRPAFVGARDQVGRPAPPLARDAALARLARRYLAGHGPATAGDLAAWSGLPLRDARAGLDAIAADLGQHGGGLVSLRDAPAAPRPAAARLLGAFDPALLGYRGRDWLVPAPLARDVHPGGGVLRPVVLIRGRVVGTWSLSALGAMSGALAREARDVARFVAGG